MIKRTCPNCNKDWYSADTSDSVWICGSCGAEIPKSCEKPAMEKAEKPKIRPEIRPGIRRIL